MSRPRNDCDCCALCRWYSGYERFSRQYAATEAATNAVHHRQGQNRGQLHLQLQQQQELEQFPRLPLDERIHLEFTIELECDSILHENRILQKIGLPSPLLRDDPSQQIASFLGVLNQNDTFDHVVSIQLCIQCSNDTTGNMNSLSTPSSAATHTNTTTNPNGEIHATTSVDCIRDIARSILNHISLRGTDRLTALYVKSLQCIPMDALEVVVEKATGLRTLSICLDRNNPTATNTSNNNAILNIQNNNNNRKNNQDKPSTDELSVTDFTGLAQVVERHCGIREVILDNTGQWNAQPDLLDSPCKITHGIQQLGQALLKTPFLDRLQLGQPGSPTLQMIPFEPELLAAFCHHPRLKCLAILRCKLSPDDYKSFTSALADDTSHWNGTVCEKTPTLVDHNDGTIDGNKLDSSDNAFFHLAAEGSGLVELDLTGTDFSDDLWWQGLMESLRRHATIRWLRVEHTWPTKGSTLSSIREWEHFHQRKLERTRATISLLRENFVIHDMALTLSERDEDLVETIQFLLMVNGLGVRRLKNSVSRAVWGQATIALRNNPATLFMLLREKPDLVLGGADSRRTTAEGHLSSSSRPRSLRNLFSCGSGQSRRKRIAKGTAASSPNSDMSAGTLTSLSSNTSHKSLRRGLRAMMGCFYKSHRERDPQLVESHPDACYDDRNGNRNRRKGHTAIKVGDQITGVQDHNLLAI